MNHASTARITGPARATTRRHVMLSTGLAIAALALCAPALARASLTGCSNASLKGRYVFLANGFTRAPAAPPGTPWVPKAILEVLQFNGDGTVLTPALTAANPFGDLGSIVAPPGGAPGEYTVNADCTGSVHFLDANNVTFAIYVESFGGTVRMIQTNPSNNVFQGTARRSW
ncbi:MAG: hypothetical protein B7X39_18810 [Lysobacterales bacterium 14-68-21]|nr:MAG: hypothetical protein B7X45_14775 [Xanthomonadales bacterium 15-68-25]OZB63583.1 MAG: hypothetical protein B7X39_18810 [Xanthomonadales bacterium 14-68-21]